MSDELTSIPQVEVEVGSIEAADNPHCPPSSPSDPRRPSEDLSRQSRKRTDTMLPTWKWTIREILTDENRPHKDKLAQETDKLADKT
ncbi:hypothetical protein F4775DRAFT_587469 [Biscogniauxia sp. FL1348]|nr:hypothetical protein F4775DRAFT_587469 [Biscogniauxia sp. FL1348]